MQRSPATHRPIKPSRKIQPLTGWGTSYWIVLPKNVDRCAAVPYGTWLTKKMKTNQMDSEAQPQEGLFPERGCLVPGKTRTSAAETIVCSLPAGHQKGGSPLEESAKKTMSLKKKRQEICRRPASLDACQRILEEDAAKLNTAFPLVCLLLFGGFRFRRRKPTFGCSKGSEAEGFKAKPEMWSSEKEGQAFLLLFCIVVFRWLQW